MEVHPFRQRLDRARRRARSGEGLLGHLHRQAQLHQSAMVRCLQRYSSLFGELLPEPFHQFGVKEVSTEGSVEHVREGHKESVSDRDDRHVGRGPTDVEHDRVPVKVRRRRKLSDQRRMIRRKCCSSLGDGLKDSNARLLGRLLERDNLNRGKVGRDGKHCAGDSSTDKVRRVREEHREESNCDLVRREGRRDAIHEDGEARHSVRINDRRRVVRLLHVLDLVVPCQKSVSQRDPRAELTSCREGYGSQGSCSPRFARAALALARRCTTKKCMSRIRAQGRRGSYRLGAVKRDGTSDLSLAVVVCNAVRNALLRSESANSFPASIRVRGSSGRTLLMMATEEKDWPKLMLAHTGPAGTAASTTAGVEVPDGAREFCFDWFRDMTEEGSTNWNKFAQSSSLTFSPVPAARSSRSGWRASHAANSSSVISPISSTSSTENDAGSASTHTGSSHDSLGSIQRA